MKHSIKLINTGSYKIGLNEVEGLEQSLRDTLKPIVSCLKNYIYWDDLELNTVEYKRRDGFIPHSHNCGGIELTAILPKCEESSFLFVEFGEHDEDCELITNGGECTCGEQDGYLDALLRIRLKFEGISEDGMSLNFYLFAEGGNHDAPYFRNLPTLFKAEFSAKSVSEVQTKAKRHISKLLKLIKGA